MIKISPNKLNWIFRSIPGFLWPIKVILLKKSLKRKGNNFRIGPNSTIFDHRLVEVGDNVFFGDYTNIACVVPVIIGSDVMFGPEVMIMGGDHNIREVGKRMADVHTGGRNEPIIIEDDVWVASRVVILKGVKIGEGAVISACSVVSKEILPYSINTGNPSMMVACRFNKNELKEHLIRVNSKYSESEIVNMYKAVGIEIY